MSTRWGEHETLVFVKLYLKHECLWNFSHEDYKFKYVKEAAINEIISKFASITNILLDYGAYLRKVKNLRSTYCQERKYIQTRSTPTRQYRPTLKWFDEYDRCIRRVNKDESDETNKQDNDRSVDDPAQDWLKRTENKDSTDESKTNDPFSQDDDYVLLLKSEPREDVNLKIENRIPKRNIKKQKYSSSSEDEVISKYKRRNKKEVTAKEDEFDIYGKYIASQLRELGLPKALTVQLKIQSIVSEARIEHLTEDE